MGERETTGLTRLELQIMQVIWRLGTASVADVQAQMAQPLAYTTVQTMLNILAWKGKLKRKLRGRAYHYSAAVSQSRATRHAVRDLVDRVFGGSAEALLMNLVESRDIDPERLAELAREMARDEREEGK